MSDLLQHLLWQAIGTAVFWLLVLPAVPIGMSWYRLAKLRSAGHRVGLGVHATLVLVTGSYLLLMLGLLARDVIGSDYSTRRYVTIGLNLGAMLVATLFAALAGGRMRPPLVLSGAWVGVSWLYVAAVSSVV